MELFTPINSLTTNRYPGVTTTYTWGIRLGQPLVPPVNLLGFVSGGEVFEATSLAKDLKKAVGCAKRGVLVVVFCATKRWEFQKMWKL